MGYRPYDTLEEVIGIRGTPDVGSLADWGVTYRENKLKADGGVDLETLRTAVSSQGEQENAAAGQFPMHGSSKWQRTRGSRADLLWSRTIVHCRTVTLQKPVVAGDRVICTTSVSSAEHWIRNERLLNAQEARWL